MPGCGWQEYECCTEGCTEGCTKELSPSLLSWPVSPCSSKKGWAHQQLTASSAPSELAAFHASKGAGQIAPRQQIPHRAQTVFPVACNLIALARRAGQRHCARHHLQVWGVRRAFRSSRPAGLNWRGLARPPERGLQSADSSLTYSRLYTSSFPHERAEDTTLHALEGGRQRELASSAYQMPHLSRTLSHKLRWLAGVILLSQVRGAWRDTTCRGTAYEGDQLKAPCCSRKAAAAD